MATKQCSKCGEVKPLEAFPLRTNRKGERIPRGQCVECFYGDMAAKRKAGHYKVDKAKARQRQRRAVAKRASANRERTGRTTGDWWDRLTKQVYRAACEGREYWGKTLDSDMRAWKARQKPPKPRRERKPWHGLRGNEKFRARWQHDPKFRIYHRMKRWMQKHLRNGRGSQKWSQVLGYQPEELASHLERQFVKGMGWHNMGQWHIDHIVPVDAFEFSSPEDEGFVACYSLANLRPIWAADNLRKRAARTHLI